jgi:hypothetical protein
VIDDAGGTGWVPVCKWHDEAQGQIAGGRRAQHNSWTRLADFYAACRIKFYIPHFAALKTA